MVSCWWAANGVLHTIGSAMGVEVQKPLPFLPANANVADTANVNQVIYAVTINNCGGADNGVWAVDVASDDKKMCRGRPARAPSAASHSTAPERDTLPLAKAPRRQGLIPTRSSRWIPKLSP